MALKLPRLDRHVDIVTDERKPSSQFHTWWQTLVKRVEDAVNDIVDLLILVGLAQQTADGALELADAAINPDGTIKTNKVLTGSIVDGGVTAPWRVQSSSVINFAAATKTQILSATVTKTVDDSFLEIAVQLPMEGVDAIDINISFEAQQSGVAIQTSPSYPIELDANNVTKLPWAFTEELDALNAGTYEVKMFGTRTSGDACSTVSTYKMRVREYRR